MAAVKPLAPEAVEPEAPTGPGPTSIVPQPQGKANILTASEAIVSKDPLQLCLPTYRDTFLAALISSAFTFGGLMALSVSEAGLPGVPKERWFVLTFRIIAWVAWYYVPVHLVAISNLRGYCVYGIAPSNSSFVCWRTALSPSQAVEVAEKTGFSRRRVFVGSVCLPFLYFLLYVAMFTLYIGEEHEHLGFIFAYGIGHIFIIIVSEQVGPKFFPPPLNHRYSNKMGPATLGVAIMGFFAVTSAYSVAKRFLGAWLGTLMPLMLGAYEIGCLLVLERTFVREFVQEKYVRRAYRHSNQGVVVSAQICLVHAMAEGGRMMLILADIANSPEGHDFLVPIVSGLVWNVMVRGGAFDRFLSILTCGRRTPTWCSLLLQQAKYCMGYPRFMALGAIVLARWCARNPLIPSGAHDMVFAVLILLGFELAEDAICRVLECLNLRVLPKQREITETELQLMAAAQLRVSQLGEPVKDMSIPPGSSSSAWQTNQSSPAQELRDQCWKLRASFAFQYGDKGFERLPFWAHFAVVSIAQFHTVLFMILLGNGLNYTLGFCCEPYNGVGRSLLWWPLSDEDLC